LPELLRSPNPHEGQTITKHTAGKRGKNLTSSMSSPTRRNYHVGLSMFAVLIMAARIWIISLLYFESLSTRSRAHELCSPGEAHSLSLLLGWVKTIQFILAKIFLD